MQKRISKILLPIIVFAVALLAFATVLWTNSIFARAEGNEASTPSEGSIDVNLTLNVNGRDAKIVDELIDSSTSDFDTNNSQNIRVRKIAYNAVVDAYNDGRSEGDKIPGSCEKFNSQTVKIGGTEISVSFDSNDTYMIVTALKRTSDVRFSVEMDTGHVVYFKVIVNDTYAQRDSQMNGGILVPATDQTIKIENKSVKEDGKTTTDVSGVQLTNFATWQFDLSELLVDRVLTYKNKSEGVDSSEHDTEVKQKSGSDYYWTVKSTDNFTVSNISFGSPNMFSNISIVNPTTDNMFSPIVSATLEITTTRLNNYISQKGLTSEDFWNGEHLVTITIKDSKSMNTTYELCVPVSFKAANPQILSLDSSRTNLNVTSEYAYDYQNDTYYYDKDYVFGNSEKEAVDAKSVEDSGYRSFIIRPTDIIDYVFLEKSDNYLYFESDDMELGSSSDDYELIPVERYGNTSFVTAFKITAHKNAQYSIQFIVSYMPTGSSSRSTVNVLTSINGYGDFTINISAIEGKHAIEYNVLTDKAFSSLRADNYQMTAVVSNNADVLDASLENNVLKLTPKIDNISGQVNASITMTFTNSSGQTIKITSNSFNININAGSFWARFDDWQGWLIIVGCVLGGILIILLIVWLFIHSISKHKQEENATAAPVSSYIVKLNSSIAATQAQQRLVATQALTQADSQMLLAAGPANTQAPAADTLALGTGMPSTPGAVSEPAPAMSTPGAAEENYDELIAKYISNDELLERIYTEKYEPKGMVRRTFFKSKDLQARELEKEKKRIIERYKTPMPMDEAIMSEAEIAKSNAPVEQAESEPKEEIPSYDVDLGFEVDEPLVLVEESTEEKTEETAVEEFAPEETAFNDAQRRDEFLQKEIEELKRRMDKVQSELDKNSSQEKELREKIAKAEADEEKYSKDIEDLEFKLASCKAKEKERINRDIKIAEEKKERNGKELTRLRAELDALLNGGQKLQDVMTSLTTKQEEKDSEKDQLSKELEKTKAELDAYKERLAAVKARQELEGKIEGLVPMLETINLLDFEMNELNSSLEALEKERNSLKEEAAAAKSQILGANDFAIISELNNRVSDANARISDIEKEITKSTKRKSDVNIDFTSQRRKANEYVEKNDIPLEELIKAEDAVIGDIAMSNMRREREKEREEAEQNVAKAQAAYDDVSASASDVTMVAMEIASELQDVEMELQTAQAELEEINAQMDAASDDEKLMLMVDQSDKSDKVDELKAKIEQLNVDGTKRKLEVQADYDQRLETARTELDEASDTFKTASARYDALADTNPLDLIVSGSGVISQDQKKLEAENYKKQLEKSKLEMEQARLAAQEAQEEAERARLETERKAEEARLEAERVAQEAIEKAEAARLEAEEKARREAEQAEQAKREAEEAAEKAKREAEEAAEQARKEAEEAAEQARREAEERAEQAKREAEEAAEKIRLEAEQAKREAEENAEKARRENEEKMIAETEEAKRKAQEEIEEMRRKAEEENATRIRDEEERQKAENERREIINNKVAARKEKIILIRERMKDIKSDEDAKNLREQLYTMQLTFEEDERNSNELMDFYNKTMDDIQHAGEVATLKAENAKKPQRVVKKVTERVNRVPRKKTASGSAARRPSSASGTRRPSSSSAARRPSSASGTRRPASSSAARRPSSASGTRRPSSSSTTRRPSGSRPTTRK